jgi:hypothetical protein
MSADEYKAYLAKISPHITFSQYDMWSFKNECRGVGPAWAHRSGRHCLAWWLQIPGRQASLFGENLHRRGTKGDPVVPGKQDIWPALPFQDSVGSATLAFDPPADPEQRGQSLRSFDGGPVPTSIFRRQ